MVERDARGSPGGGNGVKSSITAAAAAATATAAAAAAACASSRMSSRYYKVKNLKNRSTRTLQILVDKYFT